MVQREVTLVEYPVFNPFSFARAVTAVSTVGRTMPDENPYESPRSKSPRQTHTLQTSPHSTLALATFVAFGVTPGLCALAWLLGYGIGGMRELLSGYPPITLMMIGSIVFSPIHYLALVLPKTRISKIIGYAASAVAVLLLAFCWLIAAAVIANV
jgi:hypothetical protein